MTEFLFDSQGDEHLVRLVNVSSRGFALESERRIFAGEQVRLRMGRYDDFSGQIRWTRSNEAGGIFTEPVKLI